MMHSLLGYVMWSAWGLCTVWHLLTVVALNLRRSGARLHGVPLAAMRILRKVLWPVFAVQCVAGMWRVLLLPDWGTEDIALQAVARAVIFWLLWVTWRDSKNIDDDDWMKRLVEWGQGVVERVGNRLAVTVPAPAPSGA
jgi:hypothetical protein